MLVLSRRLNEKIYIGDNICITVVDIDREKIWLGIEAPRDVPIFRQELLPLEQQKAREHQHERAANQETKEDEIAERLPIQARMESRPCRRCGRLVMVQAIPEEDRRKLRTLPEAVECDKPCAVRI